MSPEAQEAAREIERTNLAAYWRSAELRTGLARLLPGTRSVDRIAYLLVCARAGGVEIDEAVRRAQHRLDELQIEAAVPVHAAKLPAEKYPLRILEEEIPH